MVEEDVEAQGSGIRTLIKKKENAASLPGRWCFSCHIELKINLPPILKTVLHHSLHMKLSPITICLHCTLASCSIHCTF